MAHQQPLRCLVTGANTGVGFEVARQLLLRGHEVILACRDTTKAAAAAHTLQQALQQQQQQQQGAADAASKLPGASSPPPAAAAAVSAVHCDLSSLASVRRCAAEVAQKWPRLDVLVCNAAVIPAGGPGSNSNSNLNSSLTEDGFDQAVQVNHLSHFLLVDLLLPCLVSAADARAAAAGAAAGGSGTEGLQQQGGVGSSSSGSSSSSRVVVVGSKQHASVPAGFDDPSTVQRVMAGEQTMPPMQLYALTKLCNMWFARHLARHVLAATGGKVVTHVVSPGFIPATELSRHVAGSFLKRLVMKYVMPWAPFAVTVQEGGRRVVAVCLGEEPDNLTTSSSSSSSGGDGRDSLNSSSSSSSSVGGGLFYSAGRVTQPGPAALDDFKAAECWRLSCKATGVAADSYGGLPVLP